MSIPYLPLYVNDFEADTAHLSIAEDGAYNRLLRLCWRSPNCTIPANPDWIRRQLRCSEEEYKTIVSPIIDEFFVRAGTKAGAKLKNPRLLREFERINLTQQKRSEAGAKGAEIRKLLKTQDPKNTDDRYGSKSESIISSTSMIEGVENYPEQKRTYREAKTPNFSNPLKTNDSDLSRASTNEVAGLKHLELELDIESKRKRVSKDTPKSVFDFLFEEGWSLYPRKVGKGQARKAWIAAAKKVDPAIIIEGLKIHLPELRDKPAEYQPHFATWLNGERWADQLDGGPDAFWADFKWESKE